MIDSYIVYDKEGNYVGHTYSSVPFENKNPNFLTRKLSSEEKDMVLIDYTRFKYDQPEIKMIPEVAFCVTPSGVYQIISHNKISISIKPEYDTLIAHKDEIESYVYAITVNDTPVTLKFEEVAYINPTEPGIYVIKLVDKRVYAKTATYVISVLE